MNMNKYQKIALLIGVIILVLIFGKTVTTIGLRTIGALGALLWKFIIVIVAIALIISFLKKNLKKKK
jgi:formate-dependent nitrite reductase membrane component NrfD